MADLGPENEPGVFAWGASMVHLVRQTLSKMVDQFSGDNIKK